MRVYLRETINGTDDVAHKRAIEGCGGGPDTPTAPLFEEGAVAESSRHLPTCSGAL